MGGVLSGAVTGLAADLAAGGLTFGAGMLTGAVLGALGGAGIARAFNVARGQTDETIRWDDAFLGRLVMLVLIRYLAVAHYGRGRGELRRQRGARVLAQAYRRRRRRAPGPAGGGARAAQRRLRSCAPRGGIDAAAARDDARRARRPLPRRARRHDRVQRPLPPSRDPRRRHRRRSGQGRPSGSHRADGSITAAAKELGMSYRRAWLLVDTMNRNFRTPVVEAAVGGTHGGGAALTTSGRRWWRATGGSRPRPRRLPRPTSARSKRSCGSSECGRAPPCAAGKPCRAPLAGAAPDGVGCEPSPVRDPMDVAFILDPLPELKAYKDSSIAMMRALAQRGHRLFALEQRDLLWDAGRTCGRARPIELLADDHDWYRAGEGALRAAERVLRGDDAQGSAVRHGVRLLDVPSRMCRARRRARVQPAARDPRQQREARDRQVHANSSRQRWSRATWTSSRSSSTTRKTS